MDNVQNCDNYINIPSSQTCISLKTLLSSHRTFVFCKILMGLRSDYLNKQTGTRNEDAVYFLMYEMNF
jgi:hypothetical protein